MRLTFVGEVEKREAVDSKTHILKVSINQRAPGDLEKRACEVDGFSVSHRCEGRNEVVDLLIQS